MEYLQPAGSQPARAAAKGEPGQRTRRYERSRLRLFPLPGERRRGPTRRGFPARPDSSRASSACRHPAADGKPWRAARFRAESSRGLSRGRRRTQRTSGDGVGRTVPNGGPAKMCQAARGAFSWRVVSHEGQARCANRRGERGSGREVPHGGLVRRARWHRGRWGPGYPWAWPRWKHPRKQAEVSLVGRSGNHAGCWVSSARIASDNFVRSDFRSSSTDRFRN